MLFEKSIIWKNTHQSETIKFMQRVIFYAIEAETLEENNWGIISICINFVLFLSGLTITNTKTVQFSHWWQGNQFKSISEFPPVLIVFHLFLNIYRNTLCHFAHSQNINTLNFSTGMDSLGHFFFFRALVKTHNGIRSFQIHMLVVLVSLCVVSEDRSDFPRCDPSWRLLTLLPHSFSSAFVRSNRVWV